jgi:sterol desaturase/sphingolipid hydroxylase (fatty acid hydroxylase superfamily)
MSASALLVSAWHSIEAWSLTCTDALGWEPDSRITVTICFGTIHSITFWLLTAFFTCLRNAKLGERWVIKPELKQPGRALMLEALGNSVINHLVLQWLAGVYLIAPVLNSFGGLQPLALPVEQASYDVTSLANHAVRIAGCVLIEDTLFYWTHRLLHQKWLYAHVHKRHHSFVSSHALAAEHAHIGETLLSNMLPFYAGPVILRLHGTTFMLWTWLRIAEAVDGHSGFAMPKPLLLLLSPLSLLHERERHDFHHSHSGGPDGVGTSGVYGSLLPFWDWAMGTDRSYDVWKNARTASKRS